MVRYMSVWGVSDGPTVEYCLSDGGYIVWQLAPMGSYPGVMDLSFRSRCLVYVMIYSPSM